MTPAAIAALVKDVLIIGAVLVIGYVLVTYGKDIVKVDDMKVVQKQITDNAATVAKWQKESTDADAKKTDTLAKISDTIANQRAPVFVRGPSCPNPVSSPAAPASNPENSAGATDQGRGIDYRPVVNQFELKYETALTECYAALDKWPHP